MLCKTNYRATKTKSMYNVFAYLDILKEQELIIKWKLLTEIYKLYIFWLRILGYAS